MYSNFQSGGCKILATGRKNQGYKVKMSALPRLPLFGMVSFMFIDRYSFMHGTVGKATQTSYTQRNNPVNLHYERLLNSHSHVFNMVLHEFYSL